MSQMILDVQAFLETGGGVLNFIGLITIVMWTLMLERFYYFYRVFPGVAEGVQRDWQARDEALVSLARLTTDGALAGDKFCDGLHGGTAAPRLVASGGAVGAAP